MKTYQVVINGFFIFGLLVLAAVIIRYPRTVFIEIPLALVRMPFEMLLRELGIGFVLGLVGITIGKDINNEYRTKRRRYLTFARGSKFLLTTGTDEAMIKMKVNKSIAVVSDTLNIDQFRFFSTSDHTITVPPAHISSHDFHFLIQSLTDEALNTVGLVENNRFAYSVYNDPKTTNFIGQTDQGEEFFVSLVDNFDKRQFLRINDRIQLEEEYHVSRIKRQLVALKTTDV